MTDKLIKRPARAPAKTTARVDRYGKPRPDHVFVENPLKALPPSHWVHIESPRTAVQDASNAEIVFWLRLKATPGCLSKQNHDTDVMHLWIEPDSEAARLFVSRMIRKLPAHQRYDPPAEIRDQALLLLTEKTYG